MTSDELIQQALRGKCPVATAIGLAMKEGRCCPIFQDLLRTIFTIYLMEKYPDVCQKMFNSNIEAGGAV